MRLILFSLILFLAQIVNAEEKILNVYCWADFLPSAVVEQFQKETGIKVFLSDYENNETLFAKLILSKKANYDVVFPSSYFVQKMKKAKLLQQIDKNQLHNFKHLDHKFLNKNFDPGNKYSIPYLWSTVGILVNKRYHDPNKIKAWKDLWSPKFKNQILLLNEPRDVFTIAMLVLQHSVNTQEPTHIQEAYEKLLKLLPNVRIFNTATIPNVYIDEDITIGMSYSGEAYHGMQENGDLVYIYPEEGFPLALDCMSIPTSAKHPSNAHRFINFLLRPDISVKLTSHTGVGTPNKTASQQLPEKIRNNPVINPSQEILKRGKFQLDIEDANALYEKYWELLKVSA